MTAQIAACKKKKTTTEEKKREWVEEPVKPETLFSVAFPSSALLLFLFFLFFCVCVFLFLDCDKIAIRACWCIKAKNSQVYERSKQERFDCWEHRHCQTQTTCEFNKKAESPKIIKLFDAWNCVRVAFLIEIEWWREKDRVKKISCACVPQEFFGIKRTYKQY